MATSTLLQLKYSPSNALVPNNIAEVRLDWTDKLQTQFGEGASFIKTGKYYVASMPPPPVFDPDWEVTSLEYRATEKDYLKERGYVNDENNAMKKDRVKIYSAMWGATGVEARNQMERDTSFAAMDTGPKDPLAFGC
jgi:hypothetical protein